MRKNWAEAMKKSLIKLQGADKESACVHMYMLKLNYCLNWSVYQVICRVGIK